MNKSKFYIPIMALLFMLGHIFQISAQTEKELLAQLVSEDQDAINALVLYPEDTRRSILEASLYPEALIKLESIQSQTSISFRAFMNKYPKNIQEMTWDLTRYPDLIHRLSMTENGLKNDLKNILKDYPDVIHQRAEEAALNYHPLLMEIDQLNIAAESTFNFLLKEYPEKSQTALRELITLPEVLTILTDNIRLTVLAGDLYRKEPEWVLHKADSLHTEVARRNAEEIEDWKASLKNDPQALEELKASAQSYEEEYGYDDDYYDYSDDDMYYDSEMEDMAIRQYYDYNYPYWFGYPSWYNYPRWRMYPAWYNWGFYFGTSGTCIVVNLPSFYFMNWYFYQPYHHQYWPHLSAHFTNHYYGHRAIGVSSINTTVADWKDRNRDIVTDEWTLDDGRLSERFKEYGKFESAREKYNQSHPQKTQTQKEYLDRNTNRYPKMTEKTERVYRNERIETAPVPSTKKKETTVPQEKNEPVIRKQLPPDRTTPKVNEGKDYHKNTWERSKISRPKIEVEPAPKIKNQPKIATPKAPKTTVPKTRDKTVKKKN